MTKTSLSLCEGTLGVLDALAEQKSCSRSEMMRRLIVTAGIDGIQSPTTDRYLELNEANQAAILGEIREKLKATA